MALRDSEGHVGGDRGRCSRHHRWQADRMTGAFSAYRARRRQPVDDLHAETFGPTIPVVKVADEAEDPAGRCWVVGDGVPVIERGERIARRLNVGAVNATTLSNMSPGLPMGG